MPNVLGNTTYYTTDEVAVAINRHLNTVKSLIRDGVIKAVTINNGYVISRDEIAKYLEDVQALPDNMIEHRLGITTPRGKKVKSATA